MTLPIIKSYRLETLLTEDTFSEVYKAVSLSTLATVLVVKYKKKWMTPSILRDCTVMAQAVSHFTHSNCVKLVDYHIEANCFYAIYPYENGIISIGELLKKESIPTATKWNWVQQIVLVCKELESKKLSHGQLNLNTVWVDIHHNIKLIKTAVGIPVISHHVTQIQTLEEAPFLAPETTLLGIITPQSDMVALATMMHLFFYEEWPYPYTPKLAKLKQHWANGRPELPKPAEIPSKVVETMDIALSLAPVHRFDSWEEWVSALSTPSLLEGIKQRRTVTQDPLHIKARLGKGRSPIKTSQKNLIMTSIAILLIVATVFSLFIKNYVSEIPTVTIPKVVGLSLEEAQEAMAHIGIKSEVVGQRTHHKYPQGYVIEAQPAEGREIKNNRVVKLMVSRGFGAVTMPSVLGRDIRTGTKILESAGLKVTVQEEIFSYQAPKGTILSQSVTPNEEIEASANIVVTVSKGFPIEVAYREPEESMFGATKKGQKEVLISMSIQGEDEKQSILITQTANKITKVLYKKEHSQGDTPYITVYADNNSYLQIYFDDEQAYKERVPVTIVKNAQPVYSEPDMEPENDIN
jgi:beta-lactam-binding protein with PASTA domain